MRQARDVAGEVTKVSQVAPQRSQRQFFYSNHYSKGSQQRSFSRGETCTVFWESPQASLENRFERGAETYAGEQLEEPAVVLATDVECWAQRGEWRRREGLLLVVQDQPSHFSSLDVHFLICEMGIIMPTPLNEMRWHVESTCPHENSVTAAIVIMMILLALLIRPSSIYVFWNGCLSTLLISLKH